MKRSLPRLVGAVALGVASFVLASCSLKADGPSAPPPPQPHPNIASPASEITGINEGEMAPDFTLPDQDNKPHTLSSYRGKTVILAFYPVDMTTGCTAEAHSLTKAVPQFQKLDALVFGISVQDVTSKKTFCTKEGIGYPLLADTTKKVTTSYGVLGPRGVAQRVTFIVGPDGKITHVDRTVNPTKHGPDLVALLSAGDTAQAEAMSTVAIGKAVEPFALTNSDGKSQTIGDWDANDTKATLLIFMSTRCPVSNAYNERMEALAKAYTGKQVRMFGIDANKAETSDEIAAFARAKGFTFQVLKDKNNIIADRFDAQVTPEAYVIDSRGILRYHGRIDDSKNPSEIIQRDLQAALDELLAGKPVKNPETQAFGCSIKRVDKSA